MVSAQDVARCFTRAFKLAIGLQMTQQILAITPFLKKPWLTMCCARF